MKIVKNNSKNEESKNKIKPTLLNFNKILTSALFIYFNNMTRL